MCAGSTVNSFGVHSARRRSIQFRIKRRIILAIDHHLAFFPRDLIAPPATHIPFPPPSVENEEHRHPELVPLLVEDDEGARWYADISRGCHRLPGFGRCKDLLRGVGRDNNPLEAGAQGESVVDFAARSDRQPSGVRLRVCLGCVGIVLPGHLRDPGDVDEIGVGCGIQRLFSNEVIDNLTASLDASIAADGLVDCVLIHVRLPKQTTLKLQQWQ